MHLFNFFYIVSQIFYKYNFYMACESVNNYLQSN